MREEWELRNDLEVETTAGKELLRSLKDTQKAADERLQASKAMRLHSEEGHEAGKRHRGGPRGMVGVGDIQASKVMRFQAKEVHLPKGHPVRGRPVPAEGNAKIRRPT
uniref:Uncharacterized protein n=1 Tax=Nelumbo nucifera TaxID=4432 RepID=A0A822YKX3_NELNU|nr:TPA_asm: hypothetical protein HUJ06_011604 [Nelumbo nucifera]